VPAERRTVEEIRGEMASERAQLERALLDLRAGLEAKRKPAARLAGSLVAGLATLVTVKTVRRFRGR
jgi:Tfp pilus assembly protein FimV